MVFTQKRKNIGTGKFFKEDNKDESMFAGIVNIIIIIWRPIPWLPSKLLSVLLRDLPESFPRPIWRPPSNDCLPTSSFKLLAIFHLLLEEEKLHPDMSLHHLKVDCEMVEARISNISKSQSHRVLGHSLAQTLLLLLFDKSASKSALIGEHYHQPPSPFPIVWERPRIPRWVVQPPRKRPGPGSNLPLGGKELAIALRKVSGRRPWWS